MSFLPDQLLELYFIMTTIKLFQVMNMLLMNIIQPHGNYLVNTSLKANYQLSVNNFIKIPQMDQKPLIKKNLKKPLKQALKVLKKNTQVILPQSHLMTLKTSILI